jgi:hypothetical protein
MNSSFSVLKENLAWKGVITANSILSPGIRKGPMDVRPWGLKAARFRVRLFEKIQQDWIVLNSKKKKRKNSFFRMKTRRCF